MKEKPFKICCPYCGDTNVIDVMLWKAVSTEDEENEAKLTEYQCFNCENKSFWI
jgi:DNA-directed RNA polymerase subunit RPC12/RpoP